MRAAAIAAFAAVLGLAQPAAAQPRPELDGPTQLDMNRQAAARLDMADKALNEAYGALMSSASPEGRRRLRDAQRAWILFRDLDCEARTGARGGSFRPTAVQLCREALTDERTRTLTGELNCEEGDMGCGGHTED